MIAIRYIFSYLWPRVVFIILTGWMLYTVLDSMEAARFLAKGTTEEVIKYYILRAPSVAADLLGPAVVLGILSGVGTLNRYAELAAFAAAGRSLATTALPAVLALAVLASGARVVLDEYVIPTTSRGVLRLAVDRFGIRGPRYHAFYQRTEWFRAGPIYGKAHAGDGRAYEGVMAVILDENHQIMQRVVAESMEPTDEERFILKNAAITTLAPTRAFESAPEREMFLPAAAAAMSAPIGFPEHSTFAGLQDAVRLRERGGRSTGAYKIALMRRFVDPVVVFLLALLALPLAARQRRDAPVEKLLFVGGSAVAVAHILMMVADELASRALLPLWMGAVAAPLLLVVAVLAAWRGVEMARPTR